MMKIDNARVAFDLRLPHTHADNFTIMTVGDRIRISIGTDITLAGFEGQKPGEAFSDTFHQHVIVMRPEVALAMATMLIQALRPESLAQLQTDLASLAEANGNTRQ